MAPPTRWHSCLLFSLVLLCRAPTTASFRPAGGILLSSPRQRRPSSPLFALSLRPAEAADVPAIIELAEDTFGADIEDFGFIGQVFNWFFRLQVLIGFEARIAAWESSGGRDHAVLVLTDDDGGGGGDDGDKAPLAGLIEISMQPMTGDTAPMLPVPMNVKRMKPISPYISNLTIDPRFRRKGHAQRLVRACEKQAVDWGYEKVYLHVDMEYPPAEKLYQKMGYGTIAEDPAWKKLLSGVQLRYMSKSVAK